MKTVKHTSDSRGHVNHGWLDSHHSFSFSTYHNPERMNFGVLRVLNDDRVSAGQGFGRHPHDNMEIISIPLYGDLEHEDSMGNKKVIKEGDIQVMSAGTGIFHSEYNPNTDKEVQFLQIWVIPNERSVQPRYDQKTIADLSEPNQLNQILSPNADDAGVWIHQNAWFHLGTFDNDTELNYQLKDANNGVYAFVLEGDVSIENQTLNKRDGLGIWETDNISLSAKKGAKVLFMEVPMNLN
ncbi:pirin family protein [Flammeovirga yaeyamensis]|uniref:Pirin family protein n=1 Tax=Flammeovirga yaeyamensis TaxID=367791 RepID=A0AAX1N6U2_9BACT|nr:pirin family protein [Flammeovirga yaeyamensis]MBB3697553.1 hypothetical protein [Flammeovirga yaeyamensis]NMF36247.1 pirin family protein [Flammeovirga yaeyamensis]QWG02976.1 pirin family protein [Flammeovirga yaeyamensis]